MGHQQLGMVGPEVGRHLTGVGGLVVAGVVEGHGEGLDLLGALGLHERHHERRVDPTGQKSPQRNVGVHPQAHGVRSSSSSWSSASSSPPAKGEATRSSTTWRSDQ